MNGADHSIEEPKLALERGADAQPMLGATLENVRVDAVAQFAKRLGG